MVKLKGRKILVLGLGRSGQSVLRFLQAENIAAGGYAAVIADGERTVLARQFPHTAFYCGPLPEVLYRNDFELLILSPGFSVYLPAIRAFAAAGGEVIGDVSLWRQNCCRPGEKIIAVTGSNGKSTVTDLVGFIGRSMGLDIEVAANIGLPVLDAYLNRERRPAAVWVLELSSFQLETLSCLNATVATCLNISADHLDRYPDLLTYAYYKDQIFNGAKLQVLNADDPLVRSMHRPEAAVKWFSVRDKADYWLDNCRNPPALNSGNNRLLLKTEPVLTGVHNMANILAAAALGEALGWDKALIAAAVKQYQGLAHRLQEVATVNRVTFIDDSKGTNVGATLAAVAAAPGPVSLILGGLAKGQDFTPLKTVFADKVIALFLIGKDAAMIAAVCTGSSLRPVFCPDLPTATRAAFKAAPPGSWVLLSPACASMDMFRDYAERSQVFRRTVEEIADAGG